MKELYVKSNKCGACNLLKNFLDDKNIEYKLITYQDLRTDRELRHRYQSFGTKMFPVLYDTDEDILFIGFNKRKLEAQYGGD